VVSSREFAGRRAGVAQIRAMRAGNTGFHLNFAAA